VGIGAYGKDAVIAVAQNDVFLNQRPLADVYLSPDDGTLWQSGLNHPRLASAGAHSIRRL
jgi:hypothetical protein